MKGSIKRWGINGEGITYLNKKAIFVENAIPGEVVEFQIDQDNGNYAKAHSTAIYEESPRRRHPMCPKWQTCGGCSLMHVDYKGQVRMKEHALQEALRKYADYTGPILPLIKNPKPLGYRNACKLPFGLDEKGRTTTGMYKKGTNEFVPLERCIIHSKMLEQVRQELNKHIGNSNLKPVSQDNSNGLLTLVLKQFDDKVHVALVTTNLQIPQDLVSDILSIPHVASVWQSVKEPDDPSHELFGKRVFHLGGEMKMTLQLDDYSLNLLPKSFFQLNTEQALQLYKLVASWVPNNTDLLIEAYSGIGAISLFASDKANETIGIELIEDAVANANENALINGKEDLSFVCGDAATELQEITSKATFDALIVDPPRSGLNQAMRQTILEAKPETLIYVSCNPATLGKDLAVLDEVYEIKQVQPFDFFSQTPHVETAVLLQKRDQPKAKKELPTPSTTHNAPKKIHSKNSSKSNSFSSQKRSSKKRGRE